MAYHGNSFVLWQELIHSFNLASVIDLTPLAERFGLACITMGAPDTAVTFTEDHATLLRSRIKERVYAAFTDATMEGIYDPMAVVDLTAAPVVDDGGMAADGAKPSAKKGAKKAEGAAAAEVNAPAAGKGAVAAAAGAAADTIRDHS
ncbi:MAG: hypothetical protein GY772_19400, partial [bacterium]|nr:hypothetical protein [bacterium]